MSVQNSVQSLDIVREHLVSIRGTNMTPWREIAQMPEYQGIPAGTLCAIAKGREPKCAKVRKILGLPILAPAPVCPTCGIPHTKRCPVRKPVPAWVTRGADFLEAKLREKEATR
jgi:hypothetical protein